MVFGRAIATLALCVSGIAPCAAQAPAAAPVAWEFSPYRITVMFVVDPATGLRDAQIEALGRELVGRCDALIGARYEVACQLCPGTLAASMGAELAEVGAAQLPPEVLERDKLVVIRLGAASGGFELRAREFCERTRTWSPAFSRTSVAPGQLTDATFALVVSAVRMVAQITSADDKTCQLKPKGCKLLTRDPTILAVAPGTVLRTMYRSNDLTGKLKTLLPVEWTFVTVTVVDGETLAASISTGLRSPLARKVRGRFEKLAVVVPAVGGGSRLELVARGEQKDPLSGYEVYAHPADSPKTVLVGRTGADGTLWIPSDDKPLRVLLIKSGGDFLARLPIVPGLTPTVRAEVADDRERLRAEGVIVSLQESLVDLVARRAVLVARIEAALDAGEVEKARKLTDDLRKLRSQQDVYAGTLLKQRSTIVSKDPVTQRKILQLFGDTEKLMTKFFDPRPLDELESRVAKAERDAKSATK